MWLASAIFVVTMILVIAQPKGLVIGWSALIGAALSLVGGIVHLSDIPLVWHIVWNATATFIAIIIISLLLDESGFFEWAALYVGAGERATADVFLFSSYWAVPASRPCLPTMAPR